MILIFSSIKNKLLPILLISVVIAIVLLSVGDLGKLIEKTTGQDNIIDLGLLRNCNPSTSICAVNTKIDGKKIRVSINSEQQRVKAKGLSLNIKVSGLKDSKIKGIFVNFELADEEVAENKQYLQKIKYDPVEINSHWFGKIILPQKIKGRNDWLSTIDIDYFDRNKKSKKIRVSYQVLL